MHRDQTNFQKSLRSLKRSYWSMCVLIEINEKSASLDWITSTRFHQSRFFVCWNVMNFDHANQSWNSTWTQSWWKHDCNFVWDIRTESLTTEKTSYEVMKRAWFWAFVEVNDCNDESSKKSMWKRAFEEDKKMSQNSCFEIATFTIKRDYFIFEKLKLRSKSELHKEKSINWMIDWNQSSKKVESLKRAWDEWD
jgi:hypothetical protein